MVEKGIGRMLAFVVNSQDCPARKTYMVLGYTLSPFFIDSFYYQILVTGSVQGKSYSALK